MNYEAAVKTMEKLLSDDLLEENKSALTKCKDSGEYCGQMFLQNNWQGKYSIEAYL